MLTAFNEDHQEVPTGSTVQSFRGESFTLVSCDRVTGHWNDGKVTVKDSDGNRRYFYAGVFNLTIKEAI